MKKIPVTPMLSSKYGGKRYGIRVIFDRWFYSYMSILNSINKSHFFFIENPCMVKFRRKALYMYEESSNHSFYKKFSKLHKCCISHSSSAFRFSFSNSYFSDEKRKNFHLRRVWFCHMLALKKCHSEFRKSFLESWSKKDEPSMSKNTRLGYNETDTVFHGFYYFDNMKLMNLFLKHFFLVYNEFFEHFYKKPLDVSFVKTLEIMLPVSEIYRKNEYDILYTTKSERITCKTTYKVNDKTAFTFMEDLGKGSIDDIPWESIQNKMVMKNLMKYSRGKRKGKLFRAIECPITKTEREYFGNQYETLMNEFSHMKFSFPNDLS